MTSQKTERSKSAARYVQMALRFAKMIAEGGLTTGQKLPSVRDCAVQDGLSVSTVLQAFRYLEEHGLVQPRPKAGYFVTPNSKAKAAHLVRKIPSHPVSVDSKTSWGSVSPPQEVTDFAIYSPKDGDYFDQNRIRVALSRAVRMKRNTLTGHTSCAGSAGTLALRNAVALRALHLGCSFHSDNIVITSGCINAVALCLAAVVKPGDMVAVESPTFFGFLDLLESLSLKPLPLPTDPKTGISLPALQLALETQPVRAVLLVPTLSNPLGSVMPLAQKRALAQIVAHHRVPLIEDVVFNDLLATDARRKAVKAFDTQGWVMACGSFTKTVAPGIRLGWVEGGRWSHKIAALKQVQGASTTSILEYALADLLTQGSYEAHLRRMCLLMQQRLSHARQLILESFPKGTKVQAPPTGYTLWVELPKHMNSMTLFYLCQENGITVGPGQLFCASQKYHHCLRLNFAGAWEQAQQTALRKVGQLASTLVANTQDKAIALSIGSTRSDFMGAGDVTENQAR